MYMRSEFEQLKFNKTLLPAHGIVNTHVHDVRLDEVVPLDARWALSVNLCASVQHAAVQAPHNVARRCNADLMRVSTADSLPAQTRTFKSTQDPFHVYMYTVAT